MKERNTTQKIVFASMLAALTCVATMLIKIPSPLRGYLNLGDCIVLLAGWMLSPAYGFLAAGIGSAFADLFSGYVVYAPATFVIKGVMALMVCYGFRILRKAMGNWPARILCALVAEVWMVLGYFVFEGCLYGFLPSAVNIPANAVQGLAGLILGCLLAQAFDKKRML